MSQVLLRALNFEWAVSNNLSDGPELTALLRTLLLPLRNMSRGKQRDLPTLWRMLKPKVIGSEISKAS